MGNVRTAEKLSTGPSRTCARGLDVDGNINIPGNSPRPRAYACTWREACKAADYVLEHFGNPLRDRGLHFDAEAEEARERENSTSWLSDRGRSAAAIRRCGKIARPQDDPATRQKRIDRAKHLVMRKAPECLQTFWLILKNGKNRKESIWQLAQKTQSK